ncbi:MAG: isoprenylcysteine carboxylmethyltransferase family protein [Bacteroidetes bacterium]|nr:isoprenylcysteine carboxylmethyltransferase family protein [Bacteroidota bacterium]
MILLVILWVLFFVSHSLLAANKVKASAQKLMGHSFIYYRILYNLLSLGFLSWILYVLLFKDNSPLLLEPTVLNDVIGIGLTIVGVLIIVLAFRNYDLGEFTGIKQLSKQIHHPEKLVIKGLNAYVRNPLYTGIIVLVAGYFLMRPTWMNLVSLVAMYIYIYIGASLEEKKLEEVFGEEYRAYQRKVKMLVPFLF